MNGRLGALLLRLSIFASPQTFAVSWSDRNLSSKPHTDMPVGGTSVELVRPYRSDSVHGGPMNFQRLVGRGIHRLCTGHSIADLSVLRKWLTECNDMVLGWFCYDLKNTLEVLQSAHAPAVTFPSFFFFVPSHVSILSENGWTTYSHPESFEKGQHSDQMTRFATAPAPTCREQYLDTVNRILRHIKLGDIYETNYCIDNRMDGVSIDPATLFESLLKESQAPFSCRVEFQGRHLLCASPERFMAKVGDHVFSQPMKGTNRRQPDNAAAMEALRTDPKERAENIMITDLVRNDLSKFAKRGSVMVEELCRVYPFAHVNQMVSTVSCELREDAHPLDMLLAAFPMGSMTGAPKVRAMQLMDEYEGFSRGLFSGSVGYFTPELDFDFNVVIRSILYDEHSNNLSFPTGSAITINSDPQREWEECQLKAEAMRRLLKEHVGKDP